MQLKVEQLAQHLQRGLAPLYVVTGDEPLLCLEAADTIRQAARAGGCSEREVLVVERSFDWTQLLASTQSMSLFGERKLLELRIPGGKPGKEGGALLASLAAQLDEHGPCVLITLPRLDRATQETAWFRALNQHGVVLTIYPPDLAQLPDWLGERLARQQQRAKRPALQFLAERVEGNLLAAHQEIQKLGLLFPAGEITLEDMQEAVLNVARYDVFKLSEAMLSGDTPRLIRMLEGLAGEGEAAVLVHWAITEDIRQLLRFQQGRAEGISSTQLARDLRLWGGKERWMEQAARRLSPEQASAALVQAAQVERLIKGLRPRQLSHDIWSELRQLALSLASPTINASIDAPAHAQAGRAKRQ